MFKHLLVPLDGSRLAEAAVPAASRFAERLDAMVTLVHVIERHAPSTIHGERHLHDSAEASAYLAEVRGRLLPHELRVEQHVHTTESGDVARSIVEHVGELAPDCIVMCTHGKRGLRDWLFGSIAQQVIARSAVPVLLVRPTDEKGRTFACERMLVPLDGIPSHEKGIEVAIRLAQAFQASIHLVMVIPRRRDLLAERGAARQLLPAATAAVLDMATTDGQAYLADHLSRIRELDIEATAELRRGDPAANIVNVARDAGEDLIVLGTHGKTGMDALWSGSVAPRIAGKTRLPLLLVRVSTE